MAKCEEGGTWDVNLQCALPVLVVAGGAARDHVNTVEVSQCSVFILYFYIALISVLPNVQCENVTIPDMIGDEGHRSLHNLAYHPRGDGELLTCNSIHQLTETTCDSWTFGQEVNGERKWSSGHSSPHKENSLRNFILYTKRVI